jgi:hypothetical protein
MHPIDADREDEFGRILAAYDDALARGTSWVPLDRRAVDFDAEILARLDAAKDLLKALDQLWPRAAGDGASV